MEFTGKLTRWDDDKRCGYITPERGGDELFMPMAALQPGMVRPQVGDTVCFRVEVDATGRKSAARVHWPAPAPPVKRVVPERASRSSRRPRRERPERRDRPRYSRIVLIVLLMLIGAGIYGFGRVGPRGTAAALPASGAAP